jgi:hypothetical protein
MQECTLSVCLRLGCRGAFPFAEVGGEELTAARRFLPKIEYLSSSVRSLSEFLSNPKQSMGHGFVLAMLLTNDSALKESELR